MKRKILLCALVLGASVVLHAQVVISGRIKSKETGGPIPSANVGVKGKGIFAAAGEDGSFSITVKALPVTLVVSHSNLTISLNSSPPLSEVIIEGGGDSRIRSKVINMPTSYERIGPTQMRNSPSPDPYDLLGYLKGVSNVQSSITMNTFSTRGFNGSGSTRVNQFMDGMNTTTPGLGFSVANFTGLTDLDIESIELLPGASSGLYGSGGMNGTILINSKNPFKYQGLSVVAKEGIMHLNENGASASPYHNFSLRYAKAFNDKFAFKIGAQYLKAKDWLANDSSNYFGEGPIGKVIPGTRASDPNYNGVNVYGDEASIDTRNLLVNGQMFDLWAAVAAGIGQQVPPIQPGLDAVVALTPNTLNISRTGYQEKNIVVDPDAKNIKLSGALHYKLTSKIEAQLMGYWGTGNTVYTGNNRYVLKDIKIGQYKLELKHPNWFLRGYTTQEDAGEAYSATLAGVNMNNTWKPHDIWFQQYAQNFLVPAATLWMQTVGATNDPQKANAAVQANFANFHTLARTAADKERPLPGSSEFKKLLDQVRKTPVSQTGKGAMFLERSQLWVGEGQYNFADHVKFVDIIVGGNLNQYILNSENTIFIDKPGHPVKIREIGAYTQLSKSLFKDYLKLSFAGRMDKNEDFKTQFTPRATALVKLAKNQNLRFSYQTAYRFASTQQKYIHVDVGSYTLLGGLPWILDSMNVKANPTIDVATKQNFIYKDLKPEKMRSFEIGYKGFFSNDSKHGLLLDVYGYLGSYRDFLGRNILMQPSTGKVYSTVLNSSTEVRTYGFGLGLDYQLPKNFSVFFNGYSDVITDVPTGFSDYFNTPKYRFNTGVANNGFGKKERLGFSAMFRWQDSFQWQGELANGPIDAFGTMDAQVSYKIPKISSFVRLGATDVFNHYYKTGYGNPEIGGLYYLSFGFHL
jgi:outer membrane receptor protein involved in Fe transport